MKPNRLREGDLVGLVGPASATWEKADVAYVEEVVAALGLRSRRGRHLLDRHGYFAGRDEERASDVQAMFDDPEVRMIWAVRGGWGSARILDHLDFDRIRANPKVVLGFSDVTSLLLALHQRTGLVTFHGPNGLYRWNPFNAEHLRRALFDGEALTLSNPTGADDHLARRDDRVETLRPGRATGPLLGGNLTVLSSIVGSSYLPDFDGAIVFLEDVGEEPYRVDRMLTQLRLAGVTDDVAGYAFGRFTDCEPSSGHASFTITDLLREHVGGAVPAFAGSMIGHIAKQFTLPVGLPVELDADRGTITLTESAVA